MALAELNVKDFMIFQNLLPIMFENRNSELFSRDYNYHVNLVLKTCKMLNLARKSNIETDMNMNLADLSIARLLKKYIKRTSRVIIQHT
ncbi:hypothetical protein GCM10008959_20220 [Deinococcus seoulensis]|uniref:Uncharacterized protein n=1 Tax=Deinococcus seoulensis TaxID=1837379 RepID=A0ABQ2RQS8_9DEIO|nr:hypothetical protein GCM10008959_20220 [Deinococcus seoulensis]